MDIDQQALDNQTERLQRSTQRAARSPMRGVRAAALAMTMGVASLSGCATIEEGAALGAGIGGAVGNLAANSTEGTLIGMAVGALAGGVISWDMQKDLEKAAEDTPITVERISDSHLQVSAPGDVLFDTNKATLSEDLKGTLAEVTEILDKGDEHLVVFEGHTDVRGGYEYNFQLGMDRAESVERFVQQVASRQDLDPGETIAISRGEMEPISEEHAQNRRVDIEILTGDDARQYMEEAQSQETAMARPGM